MEAKFKEFEFVEVDGTATGYGNLIGWIKSIDLHEIFGQPFYHVRVYSSYTETVYVGEKYIIKTEKSQKIDSLINGKSDQDKAEGFEINYLLVDEALQLDSLADSIGRNCPFCGEPCVECSHKANASNELTFKQKHYSNGAENSTLNIADVRCRSITEILEKIEIYKSKQKHYEKLCKDYPNDFDFKREMYAYASKVIALEWVLTFKNGS